VLGVELLHGPIFALGWSAGVAFSAARAPRELGATMQCVFAGAWAGVGAGLGALAGGPVMQRYGGRALFAGAAAAVVVGWALSAVAAAAVVGERRRRR
jgi:predicted MFS family arabinose efflux permease